MYGAILGDIIGSPYEFDRGNKTKEFTLFHPRAMYTDDTVMTVAVADALMCTMGDSDEDIRETLIDSMHNWGHKYPYAGYGGRFAVWLERRDREPYNSYGNGFISHSVCKGFSGQFRTVHRIDPCFYDHIKSLL